MPSPHGSIAEPVRADFLVPPPAGAPRPARRGCCAPVRARALRRAAAARPLSLLWVCVGRGIGKETLLAAFGLLCASEGISLLHLEGRDVEPGPASVLGTLWRELGLDPDASPVEALHARSGRPVVLVDRVDEVALVSPATSEMSLTLDEPAFAAAVRDALRHLTSVDLLGRNPLVRSRMVTEQAGDEAGIEERVAALRTLVHEVVGSLGASPRRAKLQRALYHTYLEPAGSQERVAELLDLPFSTYRDHLKTGIQLVGEILRQRETGEGVRSAPHPIAPPARPA